MQQERQPDISRVYPAVGDRCRIARERAGMTRDDLAAHLGMSTSSIVQLESGYQRLPLETLYMLAAVLGTDIHAVLPSLRELAPPSHDILDRVSNDKALDTQERQVLLAFFKQYLADAT